jgi:hypothetical protein
MTQKKLIVLTWIFFIVGLLVGLIAFQNDLASRQWKSYPVEAEIVHAYFKVFNVTEDSGIGYATMISYVFVLNITNLSDTTLRLSKFRLDCASVFYYLQDFSDQVSDYFFSPHTSRLVGFSQTGGTSELGLKELELRNLVLVGYIDFSPTEGRGGGGGSVSRQLPLEKISQDEFVYGTTFKAGSYFFFSNENIMLSFGNSREG